MLRFCNAEAPHDRLLAAYSSFSTVDGALSLSGVLFNAVRNLLTEYPAVLEELRHAALETRSKPALLADATRLGEAATEAINQPMLNQLVYSQVEQWVNFPNALRAWHRQRWGRSLFGSLVSFLKALGVTRIVLLIDQLEDFTTTSPGPRLNRDFARIGELCQDDLLFRDVIQLVIALHPRAQFRALHSWPAEKLGPLPSLNDMKSCVVIPPLTADGIEKLVSNYLSGVRDRPSDGTQPFTPGALRRIHDVCAGRPGAVIQLLHNLIEQAVDENCSRIDEGAVEGIVS